MMEILRPGLGLRALRKHPLAFLREAATRSDLTRVGSALAPVFLVNHPDLIRRVLHENQANYLKGPAASRVRPLFGNGLTTADGERWKEHRRLLQPLFQPARVQGLSRMVADTAAEMAERWRDLAAAGRPVDIGTEMLALTRQIILRAVFGELEAPQAAALARAMDDALQEVNRRVWSALLPPLWVPTPRNRRLKRALQTIQTVVRARATAPRWSGQGPAPWREALMALDGPMSDEGETRDEVLTILFAGHTTAAAALAWTWLLLDAHLETERRLAAEVCRLPTGCPAAATDLAALPYTRQLLDEVLRLYPPTWITARTAVAEDRLGGQRIPAGALLLVSPWAMHRHPLFWPDPEHFDPQRFASAERERRLAYAYLPFGAGPRICIGQGFAVTEMLVVLATLARRYRVRLISPGPVIPDPAIVLRPPAGTLVRIEFREDRAPTGVAVEESE